MSEETFVRELERRADDVQPRHLRFEDVRAAAYRIRRRRRATAAGAAAAVVAAVLLVPGLMGGSPRSDAPEPAPPAPTITPGQRVSFDLDAPLGEAPRVRYQRAADDVVIDGEGEHDLPHGTTQVVAYEDGYLVLADGASPLEVEQRLYRLDADYRQTEDLGPALAPIVASPDGTRIAWTEVSADASADLVVDDGTDVQRVSLPGLQLGMPIGFTADGLVYQLLPPDSDSSFWEVTADGRSTRVPELEDVWDASPVTDLVVGNTRYDNTADRPCAGAVRGGALVWGESCWYTLEDLSPDGSLVFGYPDVATPNHARLTVLDAETGEPLVRFDGGKRADVVEAAWEDDGHVLAVVQQGGRQAILRLGLDGTVERTTDFVEVHTLSVAWFLAGRPHE
jgi:hypothetical protein